VQLTQEFVSWIEEHSDFELAVPANLNLVCYRHKGGDELNEKLLNALNESGELYLTHTRLNGKFTLRFSIGQTFTERKHVQRAWEKIAHIASQL
jgi:aromatic-L-amino-acid decarboxylase